MRTSTLSTLTQRHEPMRRSSPTRRPTTLRVCFEVDVGRECARRNSEEVLSGPYRSTYDHGVGRDPSRWRTSAECTRHVRPYRSSSRVDLRREYGYTKHRPTSCHTFTSSEQRLQQKELSHRLRTVTSLWSPTTTSRVCKKIPGFREAVVSS